MSGLLHRNECGQTLLQLTSRGNAIVAELLRLADYIPPVFYMRSRHEQEKYAAIIQDFRYFKNIEKTDRLINSSPDLQDLDEEFKENHMEILTRFYTAFESVFTYITDLNKFLSDLDDGIFIYQTLEKVLADPDGKQLAAEALYLYGMMLLTIDNNIPGLVRERLIASYQRYCDSEAEQTNIEQVINLFRLTDYHADPAAKRPQAYPEAYFKRVPIPRNFVKMIVSRLRSDDIYLHMGHYPDPDHRSTALAAQASMLYVILYFDPITLEREHAKMREIVDKHFPDNWVISLNMGYTVNLADAWAPYKAARIALENTLDLDNIHLQAERHLEALPILNKKLVGLLKEGVLTEDYVLDTIPKHMQLMKEANVTLRWLLLHTYSDPLLTNNKQCQMLLKTVRDRAAASVQASARGPQQVHYTDVVFTFLLNISQYEFVLKEMFQEMLDAKQAKWDKLQRDAASRMIELSQVFSGETPLTRVEKNVKLQQYFEQLSKKISGLDCSDSTSTGRKIVNLQKALVNVEEFHQIESSLQIKQFLSETRQLLKQMIRTINIQEEFLQTMGVVSDISYAWQIIDTYTPNMQAQIQRDPLLVIKLRATFLKLACGLETPCVRINQAGSPDLLSVSQYYSTELVTYVRKVLQIIPQKMFLLLEQIIQIQTQSLQEVPTRLDKERMEEFSQQDLRYQVAQLTYQISIFTEGILLMKKTLVGVVQIDPKQLLEDGIRKELVNQVSSTLHKRLVFSANPKAPVSLSAVLIALETRLAGIRRSFEYIQDYVAIYGLKIWQEEVSRIINYYVEQECNQFLRSKVLDFQSAYQSKSIPIPMFPQVDSSHTCVGRLANELLRLSMPSATTYVEMTRTWYDTKTKEELLSGTHFHLMQKALSTFGVMGMGQLFSFSVVSRLQSLTRLYNRTFPPNTFKRVAEQLIPHTALIVPKAYTDVLQAFAKQFQPFIDRISEIGQYQLLRRMISSELNSAAKFDGKLILSAAMSLDQALLNEMEAHFHNPEKPYPGGEDGMAMAELNEYLETLGVSDPLEKIYVTEKRPDHFATFMFYLVLYRCSRLAYSAPISSLVPRKPQADPLDGAPFICGVITVLKQFHSAHTLRFFEMMGQFIKSNVIPDPAAKQPMGDIPQNVVTLLAMLDQFSRFAKIPRSTLERSVPPYLLSEYAKHAAPLKDSR
eukprot:m.358747 g.358747  ORF g.358747 m.358747 type:complete len:1177 (-) comp18266_c0_seq1:307-3837(-)